MKRAALALFTTLPTALYASDLHSVSLLRGCLPEQIFKKSYTSLADGHTESSFAGLKIEVCGHPIAEEGQVQSAKALLKMKGKESYSSAEVITNVTTAEPAILDAYEYRLELMLSDKAASTLKAYTFSGAPVIVLVAVNGLVVSKFAFVGRFSGQRLEFGELAEPDARIINNLTTRSSGRLPAAGATQPQR